MLNFHNFDFNFLDVNSNLKYKTQNINSLNEIVKNINECFVLSMNIRSIHKHFNELLIFLSTTNIKFDIICLFETWLEKDTFDFTMDGFSSFNYYSKLNKSDGITVFMRNSIKINSVNLGEISFCSSLNLNIIYNDSTLNLICVYRSPSLLQESFLDSLEMYFDGISNDISCIFCGDINIDLNKIDAVSVRYQNILSFYGFKSCINEDTRVNIMNGSSTCIDHIFLKNLNDFDNIIGYVCQNNITDHYSTILSLNKIGLSIQNNNIFNIKKIDYILFDKLKHFLGSEYWVNVLNSNNVDTAVSYFFSKIDNYIKMCKLTKNICLSKSKIKFKKWITSGIVTSIRCRDRLFRKLKEQPFNSELKIKYRKYRNLLTKVIKCARDMYFTKNINMSKGDPKHLWNLINEAMYNKVSNDKKVNISSIFDSENKIMTDDADIANEFNTFFATVGENIADQIKIHNPAINYNSNIKVNSNSIFLSNITKEEIKRHILSCKENTSFYNCNLSNHILKQIVDYILVPLEHIFNLSISLGIFPNLFKHTLVVPLFKQGDKKHCSNYRPISLTYTLSKILEKCLKTRLYNFLEKSNVFSENQFGFRQNKGTSIALQTLVSCIHNKLDEGNSTLGIFLDVKKAFDSVDHKILLNKLDKYGIRGVANNLIKSFLENRRQQVRVNDILSNVNNLNYGVPQGTVLGPLLFIVYINDLLDLDLECSIFCFADDTTILIHDLNKFNLIRKATKIMSTIKNWFNANSLEINFNKTCYIPFSISKVKSLDINEPIKIHDDTCQDINLIGTCNCNYVCIRGKETVKYLGVMIDKFLKWNFHIDSVIKKLRSMFGRFKALNNILSPTNMKMVFCAIAQSVYTYGICVWGGTFDKYLGLLRTTINSLLRIAFKQPFHSNIDRLYYTYDILNLEKSHAKEVLTNLYFYKIINVSFDHSYFTRHNIYNVFRLYKYNTEFGKKDPFNIGIHLCMKYNIPIKQFYNNYEHYKRYIKHIIKSCL